MARKKKVRPPDPIWAYSYELVPPQGRDRLSGIKDLLDQEHSRAEPGSWRGRLVQVTQITHILVVSDNPDQTREVNQRLTAELERLDAPFSVTIPIQVR